MHTTLEHVTFGMGCFWTPEALFGHLPGVIRTQTGYAGGTTTHPTYREMGDHTETVEVAYDPAILSLEDLLDVFWSHHNPVNINGYKGRQYQSLLLYRDDQQRDTMLHAQETSRGKAARSETEVVPYQGFHPAEDRHQKYYSQRYPDAMAKLSELYPSFEALSRSTLAARLNGIAKGFTSRERVIDEIHHWTASPQEQHQCIALLRRIRW